MRTWKDLEHDFRALHEYQDAELQHRTGAQGERWDVNGHSPHHVDPFRSLAAIAGTKVRDLPAAASWPGVIQEQDDAIRWYLCLKHFSANYRADASRGTSWGTDTPAEGAHTSWASLNRVFAESSALCVRMESLTVAPRLRLEALRAAPRYAGQWHHWSAAQASLEAEEANLPQAVADAVHAVEGLACLVLNKPTLTLGAAAKELRDKGSLHAALSNAIERVYGYTSDVRGIRHGAVGAVQVKAEEARFAPPGRDTAAMPRKRIDAVASLAVWATSRSRRSCTDLPSSPRQSHAITYSRACWVTSLPSTLTASCRLSSRATPGVGIFDNLHRQLTQTRRP
jgi:hypothetical protein